MLRTCFFITLVGLSTPVFAQVSEVLESYFEAAGGKEKIARMKSSKEVTRIVYFPADTSHKQPPVGDMTAIKKLPCYQSITGSDLKGGPTMIILCNDKGRTTVWITGVQNSRDVASVIIDPAQRLLDLYNKKKLSFEREETRKGISYTVIRSKEKDDRLYYFNKETHLLDGYVKLAQPDYMERYSDYREITGIKHPFVQETCSGDVVVSRTSTSSMEFNPVIESNDIFYYKDDVQTKLMEAKVKFKSERLESGDQDLPNFIKANFNGKKVFVDLWATWCGPCKLEFRNYDAAYYSLMDKYNLSLLYLSIDKDAQEKAWEKDIDRLGLKGYHARVNRKMMDTITRSFFANGIVSIPHYIIFDEHGEVISHDAVKPSNPEFEKNLERIFSTH